MTDKGTRQGIHFVYRVTIFKNEVHREGAHAKEYTVADEVRRIFAQNNALAQAICPKPRNILKYVFICVSGWNHFQQLQVTRRIEEVCSQEMLLKFLRTTLGNI